VEVPLVHRLMKHGKQVIQVNGTGEKTELVPFNKPPVLGCTNTDHRLGRRGYLHGVWASMALYFYRASKKSLHKPRATFANMLFKINYYFNNYLQLLSYQFMYKAHLNC
jgi:hypothetical protein